MRRRISSGYNRGCYGSAAVKDHRPRKVPQQQRSQETVNAVFEAVVQMIEKRDVNDPTVSAIAERAGVSVGSVYQYFPTKEALIASLIGFHLKQRMAELDAAIASVAGLGAEPAAERLVDHLLGSKRSMVRVENAMLRYFVRVGDLPSLTAMDEHMNQAVARFLSGLGTQIRPVNLETASFLISNALRSAVLLSVVQKPERLSDPDFRNELVQLVVRYLRPG